MAKKMRGLETRTRRARVECETRPMTMSLGRMVLVMQRLRMPRVVGAQQEDDENKPLTHRHH